MRILIALLIPASAYSQTQYSFHQLKSGKLKGDTSFVYSLPYETGKSYFLVQGYDSKLSHRGEIALDFKMKKGTPVCAVRNGKVVEIKEDSNKGGLKTKYYAYGNYILIRHSDNSFAWYFHLQKNGALVSPGDEVKVGQVIGRSGNTGYSAFPHLHIEVVIPEASHYKQIPMRFQLRDGVHYLKPWHFYRNKGISDKGIMRLNLKHREWDLR